MFTIEEKLEIAEVKEKIRTTIKHKIEALPASLHAKIHRGILTGGAIASVFHKSFVNDWDIYLTDKKDIDEFSTIVQSGEDFLKYVEDVNPKYMVADTLVEGKVITARAVTFNNSIQVITMETKDHRTHFDFVHCMPYYDIAKDVFYISKDQYTAIKNKKIVINPKAKEVAQYRIEKYLNRGWTK